MSEPEFLCKTRVLHFWGGDKWGKGSTRVNAKSLDNRLIITPYMDPKFYGTPIPFFPHSLVTLPKSNRSFRKRSGYILGKNCNYLNERRVQMLMKALYESKFNIHVATWCDSFVVPVIVEGLLSPTDFSLMLRNMSFVVGLGSPVVSPTPLEALANGATFIDTKTESPLFTSQHAV